MDWNFFLVIVAQVSILSVLFPVLSIPLALGLRILFRAVRHERSDQTSIFGGTNSE